MKQDYTEHLTAAQLEALSETSLNNCHLLVALVLEARPTSVREGSGELRIAKSCVPPEFNYLDDVTRFQF